MTFRDLQKLMEQEQSTTDSVAMQDLQRKLRDRPFYIWSSDRHKSAAMPSSKVQGYCCFNHIIPAGLPKKNAKEFPLFDYEHTVYRTLTEDGYLNARSPTQEEEQRFTQLEIELERNIVSSKKESIKKAQSDFLKYKDNALIYPFKKKHVWIKKAILIVVEIQEGNINKRNLRTAFFGPLLIEI
jgi:hypothetical protein